MLPQSQRPPGNFPAAIPVAWSFLVTLGSCADFKPGADLADDANQQASSLQEASSSSRTSEEQPARQSAAPVGQDWSCVDDSGPASTPPIVMSSDGAARLVQSVQFLSLATNTVLPNISVRACAQRDVECNVPVTDEIPLDSEGWVDLSLYEGFDGYLEILGEEILPTMLFYADALNADNRLDREPFGLVEQAVLPGLSGATGTPQDLSLGLVVLRSFDCNSDPAPGVQFRIDRPGAPWYFVGGLPSSAATETSEESGLGGFINVDPGITIVQAELARAASPRIARAKTVLVRPGWMTALRFIPAAQ